MRPGDRPDRETRAARLRLPGLYLVLVGVLLEEKLAKASCTVEVGLAAWQAATNWPAVRGVPAAAVEEVDVFAVAAVPPLLLVRAPEGFMAPTSLMASACAVGLSAVKAEQVIAPSDPEISIVPWA